ncbi:fimbrial protein [Serratia ureilytica]|uniref:fimbrial protein n=1 Tax=Serratia ureilytica TaxID=300181 RepID=UPI00313BDDBE
MKLNKIMLAAVMALGVSSLAHAADQGHGKVTFSGSIIDAPCSIAPESEDQTVKLGAVSNVALKDGGKSPSRSFDIQLENCALSTKKTVELTFTGTTSAVDSKLLGISGTAQGAGIAITDKNGAQIELGKASAPYALLNGNNTLSFGAYLQGSAASNAAIVPGEFTSVAEFTLAYQ